MRQLVVVSQSHRSKLWICDSNPSQLNSEDLVAFINDGVAEDGCAGICLWFICSV